MADPIDKLLDKLDREIDYRAGLPPDVRLRRLTSRVIVSDFVESLVEEALGKSNPAPVTREAGPAPTIRSLEE